MNVSRMFILTYHRQNPIDQLIYVLMIYKFSNNILEINCCVMCNTHLLLQFIYSLVHPDILSHCDKEISSLSYYVMKQGITLFNRFLYNDERKYQSSIFSNVFLMSLEPR
jgi:hypothetical protein